MKILRQKRCVIGEGPYWNPEKRKLYFTNGMGWNEICIYDPYTDDLIARPIGFGAAAFAFDTQGRLIVSHADGVHILNDDNSLTPIYDNDTYRIRFANDMKVGPDGAIWVGTQSGKRKGVSDAIDGKLYRISPSGEVSVMLDGLILSNGMEWSIDEKKFYHTDSDTSLIREYDFDKETGAISFTGRELFLQGVDGFTIGRDERLYVGCWGQGYVAVVDTNSLSVVDRIPTPCRIPSSCGFCGEQMNMLAITTACYGIDASEDAYAGFTLLRQMTTTGRVPYLYSYNKTVE